jgi:uncharacterized LabA/DUF88 family protein
MAEERVCIFIDGSNLYHSLNDTFGRQELDFQKFMAALRGGRPLTRAYYYNVSLEPGDAAYAGQQRFLAYLKRVPYLEVKLGRLVKRSKTYTLNCPTCLKDQDITNDFRVEKGVDVRLATDMLTMAVRRTYDTVVLVSGDGDYRWSIQAVKDLGLHVENFFTRNGLSPDLPEICDRFVELDAAFLTPCWR